tara:strand:+ start:1777 stop:3309 length:1533 start_codon:yes stop_codon:yes gene_type:complete
MSTYRTPRSRRVSKKQRALPRGSTLSRFTVNLDGNVYDIQYSTDVANNDYLDIVKVTTSRFGISGYEVKGNKRDLVLQNEETKKKWSQILAKHKLELTKAGPEFYNKASQAANRSGNGKLFAEIEKVSNNAQADSITKKTDIKVISTSNTNTAVIEENGETNSSIGIQPIPDGDKIVGYAYPKGAYEKNDGSAKKNIQDHLIIEAFKYKAPQSKYWDNDNGSFTTDAITKGLDRNSNIQKYHGLVKLPIPNELQMSNGISWGDESANAFTTAAFLGAASTLNDVGLDPWALGVEGVNSAKDVVKNLGKDEPEFKKLASAFGAQFALGSLGINVDPGQMVTRATGSAINPNLELLFNGPKLRNFSFNFLFAPNDPFEASEVRKIQKFLKRCMSPSRNSGNRLFIDTPDVFRIRFRSGDDRIGGVGMMKICAMTKCAINYTPENSWMTYNDDVANAMPVRSNMTCDFTELTPIFQDHYEDSVWGTEYSDLKDLQANTSKLGGFKENTDDVGF